MSLRLCFVIFHSVYLWESAAWIQGRYEGSERTAGVDQEAAFQSRRGEILPADAFRAKVTGGKETSGTSAGKRQRMLDKGTTKPAGSQTKLWLAGHLLFLILINWFLTCHSVQVYSQLLVTVQFQALQAELAQQKSELVRLECEKHQLLNSLTDQNQHLHQETLDKQQAVKQLELQRTQLFNLNSR